MVWLAANTRSLLSVFEGQSIIMNEHKDYSILECVEMAERLPPEAIFHQKFTCTKCGARQTMAQPDTFFVEGSCEECGHITNINKAGCNLLVIMHGKLK
jgi:hypothetical protein